MASDKLHWDGAGHPILDFFGMRSYFSGDNESLAILKKCPPHLYEVLPTITIILDPANLGELVIYKVYPGGQERSRVFVSERVIAGLRKTFCKKGSCWQAVKDRGVVKFCKPARVVKLNPVRACSQWVRF